MRIYNITGYLILFSYMPACMYSAPTPLGASLFFHLRTLRSLFCRMSSSNAFFFNPFRTLRANKGAYPSAPAERGRLFRPTG